MRKTWQKLSAIWPILVALVSGASGTYAWVASQVDKRIQTSVSVHDRELDAAAHPTIQVRLKALEDYWTAHLEEHNRIHSRLSKEDAEIYELYWFAAGDKAANLEPDRKLRALAAEQARERFRLYVKDGESFRDAYRHALESSLPR